MLQQYIIQHLNSRVYKTRAHLHDSIDSQRTSENTFSSVKTLNATKTHKICHQDTKYATKTHKICHQDTKYATKTHKICHQDTKYATKTHKTWANQTLLEALYSQQLCTSNETTLALWPFKFQRVYLLISPRDSSKTPSPEFNKLLINRNRWFAFS